ncbi:MAG: UDP-2,3-diacylglucosamine diphosphatase [Verrucomicrobium sp.]|nr:UDP-2,3-diacylglucosamine diphosphatase [Verrucomicrobium sp.]
MKWRTGFISDLHLGTPGCQAGAILEFLRDHDFDTLFLVGDIVDIWALRRRRFWPQEHNDVIQKLLRKARKGTRVVYIPGNHDEFVGTLIEREEFHFGNVEFAAQAVHVLADGRRLFVMHGHELDGVVQNLGWLAHVGDFLYGVLLRLNGPLNFFRRLFGRPYWSLSAYIKNQVKDVVKFLGDYEAAIAKYAAQQKADAVLCGHIHHAGIRQIGAVTYCNDGDWVESCTAILEDQEGRLTLYRHPRPGS